MKVMNVISLMGLLLLGGCSLQQSKPSVTEYLLKPAVERVNADGSACQERTLRIALTQAPQMMERPAIFYVDEHNIQYRYSRSRWSQSPDKQWRHLLEEEIGRSGMFKGVISYTSQAFNDLLLESRITDFMQYFKAGKAYVHVVMQMTLIDQESRKVVATHVADKRLENASADAEGAVAAFNQIVAEILKETVEWLDGECK